MHRYLALAAAAALPALAAAEPATWTIDPAHTNASFTVKHLVVSTVRGEFGKTTGVVKLDDADLARSSVEATVDVTTLNTRVTDRDNHLKSPDFFDAAHYPAMTFKSTKVQPRGEGRLDVTGELTIRGTTRPVVFDVSYSKPITGMKGERRRGFEATATINRKDFGLAWSKMVEAGPVVGDTVNITVDAEAILEQPKASASK
jgi:polyisoprenoid-binding protein YceI